MECDQQCEPSDNSYHEAPSEESEDIYEEEDLHLYLSDSEEENDTPRATGKVYQSMLWLWGKLRRLGFPN